MAKIPGNLEQRFPAEPIACAGTGLIVRADGDRRLRETHRVEEVGAGGARHVRRPRTDVQVELIDVSHARRIEASR